MQRTVVLSHRSRINMHMDGDSKCVSNPSVLRLLATILVVLDSIYVDIVTNDQVMSEIVALRGLRPYGQ